MLKAAFRTILIGFLLQQVGGVQSDDSSFFAARREILMKKIEGSVAVLQGAPETRSYISFRQDNDFYYLTGVEEPNAFVLIDASQNRSILFLPPRNQQKEEWEGLSLVVGPEALDKTGFDEVMEVSQFWAELEKRRNALKILYTPLAPRETAATSRDRALQFESAQEANPWDGRLSPGKAFKNNLQAKLGGSVSIEDLSPILDDMRRVKDIQEITRLREAARIGALGLKEAMQFTKPDLYEYQIAAVAEFYSKWHGTMGSAFFPIVGSGPNACILHYHINTRKMRTGDIVLMDFGVDYRYYSSDITRTFPVSGRFTEEQAKIYQIVLDAQKAALEKVRPGATFNSLSDAAREALARFGYDRYLKHGVSHYIGMSVHDVGQSEPFVPGVVVSVEPGVYFPEKGLGIRIEDTVLVTQDGYEILSKDVPKEIDEIERLMAVKKSLPFPTSEVRSR